MQVHRVSTKKQKTVGQKRESHSSISPKEKMERCIIVSSSTFNLSQLCPNSSSILPFELPKSSSFSRSSNANSRQIKYGFCRTVPSNSSCTRAFSTNAVLSDVPQRNQYFKVGAESTGSIPSDQLLHVIETAAKTGAQVIMDAVNKPRNITYKGLTDLVTDTDKMSEVAILDVVRKNFPDHLILGEEGGLVGDSSSDYLWCIDPLDGTTNFAHCYPSFAVSISVLYKGKPAAATVVEFVGGPKCWNTRTFTAAAGKGAFCNGEKIHASSTDMVERSLLVTGFGYEHDDAWATNIELFKEFTDVSRGVRRLGAAAVDMCHVALGIVEGYWEYRLKPWDMAAGVLIVEEAGGTVSCMDGGKFCVFDRSVLVSNGVLHAKLLERIGPATEKLKGKGIDFSLWYKPENYHTEL